MTTTQRIQNESTDQTCVSVRAAITAPVAAVGEMLTGHPEVWLGHGAPDVVVGNRFATRSTAGHGTSGEILAVSPEKVQLSWQPTSWTRPGLLTLTVSPAPRGAELNVAVDDVPDAAAEEETRTSWLSTVDTMRALVETGGHHAAPGQIKAVLFDADGVLQMPHDGWLEDFERIGGAGFVEQAFQHEVRTLTGKLDLRDGIQAILAERGRTGTDEVLASWHRINVDQDAIGVVTGVRRRGLITALATNQQSYRGAVMRDSGMDGHFDKVFYSYEVGLAKPDPAYFTHIVDELGLAPDEALFFDDTAPNVLGARAAGLWSELHRWADGPTALIGALARHGVNPAQSIE